MSRETVLRQFEPQIRQTFRRREAKLIRGVTVIEKLRAFTYPGRRSPAPRQRRRPAASTNLYLAGDYTLSGWPATMEGAVRSGYLAADAVLNKLSATSSVASNHKSFLVNDLPPQWPARWLGRRT